MTARLAVLTLAAIIAMGGLGIGVARTLDDDATAGDVEPVELRKDDSSPELVAQAGDDDDDPSGDGDAECGCVGTGRGGAPAFVVMMAIAALTRRSHRRS